MDAKQILEALSIPVESEDEYCDSGSDGEKSENEELESILNLGNRNKLREFLNEPEPSTSADIDDRICRQVSPSHEFSAIEPVPSTSQAPVLITSPKALKPATSATVDSDKIATRTGPRSKRSLFPPGDSDKNKTAPQCASNVVVRDIPIPVRPKKVPARNSKKKVKKHPKWKEGKFISSDDDLKFTGSDTFPTDILELETPYQFFSYFFNQEIKEHIVTESIRYSVQKNVSRPYVFTVNELNRFIGVCTLMSIVHLPNSRSYWDNIIGNDTIKNSLSLTRFEEIRKFLHFNDNTLAVPSGHHGHDRLHKLRPIITHFQKKFRSITLEEFLSVDEQLCPTKAHIFLRQYLPNKPKKWGYKLFALCGVSGFEYDFEIYSGQENYEDLRQLANEPDLGACANVVVRLTRILPGNVNHKLYFDNYYTTTELIVYLANKGIHSLGTVRRNRLPGVKLPAEAAAKKLKRGESHECVARKDGVPLTCTLWKDNKPVVLLSNYVGTEPQTTVRRFNKKTKEREEVSCPKAIITYNKHMGGVDLMDSFLARHRTSLKSKKWYMKLFFHLLDTAVANAWILYRRVQQIQGSSSSMVPMTLGKFKQEIAGTLCKIGKSTTPKRGRPLTPVQATPAKRRRGPSVKVPSKDIQLDGLEHYPTVTDERPRCKFPGCNHKTSFKCLKCDVHLCLLKDRNCFTSYHSS